MIDSIIFGDNSLDYCYNFIITYNCDKKVVGCPGIPDNTALAPITDKLLEIKRTDSTVNITPGNYVI